MVEPKVVAACGACACSGGIFKECYNVSGGVDTVIPVDVYVPGCAVRPESIIDAVVLAIDALDAKAEKMKADVLILNMEKIHDNADYKNYNALSDGIDYVMINGQIALDDGKFNIICVGKVVRHKS